MKIVLDVFGGDNAPGEILAGAAMALAADKELKLILCGRKEAIEDGIVLNSIDESRVEVVSAADIITNDDVPTRAIAGKKNSSLVIALNQLNREDAAGFVSAGSTGAVLTGAVLITKRIRGISRPALAPVIPTVTGGRVLLVDCGANVDCKSINLCDFALMGTAYMKACGVENPRVALLSNGTEDKKGNELNKETFPLLKELEGINFVGNMEARDMLSGDYDVIVTDGFAGNIALKSLEGTAQAVFAVMREEIAKKFRTRLGAAFMLPALRAMRGRLDYTKGGGAVFLGVEKIIVKSHGSSKASSICASILQAKELAEAKLVDVLKETLSGPLAARTAAVAE